MTQQAAHGKTAIAILGQDRCQVAQPDRWDDLVLLRDNRRSPQARATTV